MVYILLLFSDHKNANFIISYIYLAVISHLNGRPAFSDTIPGHCVTWLNPSLHKGSGFLNWSHATCWGVAESDLFGRSLKSEDQRPKNAK